MKIRQETPADYAEVYELVKISFATSTNEGEWDYLNEVRKKAAFIPELSLVAENDDGRLVGQIVLYKTMKEAFQIAQELGYTAVFLCGDPQFYHRFGIRGSYEFGIYHVADKSRCGEWCMALELKEGALSGITGTIDIE